MTKREGRTTSWVVESVRYAECQRNYVAFLGGYAVDGCREFLASGEQGMAAFTCHACGCHRSFHRREVHREVVCDFSPPNSETSSSITYLLQYCTPCSSARTNQMTPCVRHYTRGAQ